MLIYQVNVLLKSDGRGMAELYLIVPAKGELRRNVSLAISACRNAQMIASSCRKSSAIMLHKAMAAGSAGRTDGT